MSSSVVELDSRAESVEVTSSELLVNLKDGRRLGVPITWFPRLLAAPQSARQNWLLLGEGEGIHWPDIDEDLSISGLLVGARGR
jgi:hypothetical protein